MVTKVIMPKVGLTMTKGTITEWLKKEGENVSEGEPLFVMETEKVENEVDAPASGVLSRIAAPVGSEIPVSGLVAIITVEGEALPEIEAETKPREEGELLKPERIVKAVEARGLGIASTPVARRLAEEYGIDLTCVQGTGPDGRITREDVMTALEESKVKTVRAPQVAKVVNMSATRKTIAEKLSRWHHEAVHLTITSSADMLRLISFKERLEKQVEKDEGVKVTYTPILVKIVSVALKELPLLNSLLAGDEIHILKDINIGVAVDTEHGLIVPVICEADKKKLKDIVLQVNELVEKARNNKLSIDDVTGGTFTISNLGKYSVEVFTPILNPPQSAILGIGRIMDKPWVVNEEMVIRPIATFSLSFDHRIIDGMLAAQFIQRVKEITEDPDQYLIEEE
jgi:pyruvate dehydrogenase E2 component (dihydrolipoamide acetyltransferase)